MRIRPVHIISQCISLVMLTLFCSSPLQAAPVGPDFAELAKKLKPTVVNISTAKTVKPQRPFTRRSPSPFGSDPFEDFFERFFGEIPQRSYREKSLGSGFIISDEGFILTNSHVVSGADEIKVKLSDGREFKGEVKGLDEKIDIGLIKIDAKDHLPVASLGDSDRIQVGEWVMAIGNPFGLAQTVTAGIVSATGRVIGTGPYDDFIQTDASINPGNSGGPLFNINGEVIGINTAIVAGGQGIGFAIPVNMAKNIISQLKETGKVTRGWLGVVVQPITPELAQSFGLEGKNGALVSEVVKDGPADKAGMKAGDIVLEFNGKKISEMNDLPRVVASTPVGREVPIRVLRDGKQEQVTVTIERLKDEEGAEKQAAGAPDRLGMNVAELTAELAAKMGSSETKGVVVTEVKPGGLADEAGIALGDIIREVNGQKIGTLQDYKRTLERLKKGEVVRLLLRRADSSLYVALKLE